jgi:ubiquinone/menaquinone biosynthesis C-methylase UbiE
LNILKLFDDKADIYAKARPRYPSTLYKWLSELCAERKKVWDVGCGSGQASYDLGNYFDFVEATDVSASQIENAPLYPRVQFSVQPAESTNFSDDGFDAVCVAQALHWF